MCDADACHHSESVNDTYGYVGRMHDKTNLFVGCGRQSVICTDTKYRSLLFFFFVFISFSRLIEIYCLLDGTLVECCLFEELFKWLFISFRAVDGCVWAIS